MIDILSVLAVLLYTFGTFAFCYGFTTICLTFLNRPLNHQRIIYTFIFFFINFISFIFCKFIDLGIVINWIIFLFIAFIQTFFILKAEFYASAFLSLQASLCGLNSNLFSRSLLSIILNIPLSSVGDFDSNLVVIPVIISFLTCFSIFMYYSKERQIKPIRRILQTPRHLKSLLLTMAILLAYLLLQNFLYTSDKNTISLKIWSLLSCIYISFGFLWSIKYAVRFSYLYYLDDQNINLRRILHDYEKQEQNLKQASDYDSLTGILNRRAGDNSLSILTESNIDFSLCLIDLDGLKYVNDNLGHHYGDIYLKSVANLLKDSCRSNKDILFRYGGDEFVIAFVEMSTYDVCVRMQNVFNEVVKLNETSDFPMSISYGISNDYNLSLAERLEQADTLMYEMKSKHKKENPNFIRN